MDTDCRAIELFNSYSSIVESNGKVFLKWCKLKTNPLISDFNEINISAVQDKKILNGKKA